MNLQFLRNQKSGSQPKTFFPVFCFLVLFFLGVPSVFANLLGNASFEEPIGNGTQGNWDDTNGVKRFLNSSIPLAPPAVDGVYSLDLVKPANFTFQTHTEVKPGQTVTFSGRGWSDATPGANGAKLVIEFKKSNSDGSTTKISEIEGSEFINNGTSEGLFPGIFRPTPFTVSGVAPEGTDTVVFTIRGKGAWGGGGVLR